MSHRVDAPTRTSDVIHVAFTPRVVDGGKARIRERRHLLFVSEADTSPSEMNPAQAD